MGMSSFAAIDKDYDRESHSSWNHDGAMLHTPMSQMHLTLSPRPVGGREWEGMISHSICS